MSKALQANGTSAYDPESIESDIGRHSSNKPVHDYALEDLTRIATPYQGLGEMFAKPSASYASVKAR